MKQAFIFGAGATGKFVYDSQEGYEIIGVIDNDKSKWGETTYEGLTVYCAEELLTAAYDEVLLASLGGYGSMEKQLIDMGVPAHKINKTYIGENTVILPRITFLNSFSTMCHNLEGSVAEVGVFQGEFAKEINRAFPERTIFLFDTFEGFQERDLEIEKLQKNPSVASTLTSHFAISSEELVMDKMPYPEKCILKTGYFPETTKGLEEEKFCFVNLDADLYEPTLAGLTFFLPRMVEGGCILIHDYFSTTYPNVKEAVAEYEKQQEIRLYKLPIGDTLSMAIII